MPAKWKSWKFESFKYVKFLFFLNFFISTIYYMVLDRSPRQTIQSKYSLLVYKCKIDRETAALTSPF
jgi:hypothetical protein